MKDLTVCPKCKKDMTNAEFLMMGVKFKCFDCEEAVSELQWKQYEKKISTRKSTKSTKEDRAGKHAFSN